MGGRDKLDMDLAGRPVLRWAVDAMRAAPTVADVIVVTARERVGALAASAWLPPGTRVIEGGARRQDSVAAGVRASSAAVVLVHDAARPFASAALVARVVEAAVAHGAAIPVLPVVDALKRVAEGRLTGTAERAGLYRAQTPQAARRDLLLAAVDALADGDDDVPDEAELLARHGVAVATVEGEAANLKVTIPEDLALARLIAGHHRRERYAQGSDSHPFGPADGLRLGGIGIDGAPRLHGHSDGDVVLHALCDGLLAAAGEGDLGRLFPAGEPATRDVDSRELVRAVVARLAAAGRAPASADITITGARPRLGGRRLDAMAETIADLLGVERTAVSVKAASGNLAGDEGAGRVISATCLAGVVEA